MGPFLCESSDESLQVEYTYGYDKDAGKAYRQLLCSDGDLLGERDWAIALTEAGKSLFIDGTEEMVSCPSQQCGAAPQAGNASTKAGAGKRGAPQKRGLHKFARRMTGKGKLAGVNEREGGDRKQEDGDEERKAGNEREGGDKKPEDGDEDGKTQRASGARAGKPKVGDVVQVHGLIRSPELNDKYGLVIEDRTGDRVGVKFLHDFELRGVRAECLTSYELADIMNEFQRSITLDGRVIRILGGSDGVRPPLIRFKEGKKSHGQIVMRGIDICRAWKVANTIGDEIESGELALDKIKDRRDELLS